MHKQKSNIVYKQLVEQLATFLSYDLTKQSFDPLQHKSTPQWEHQEVESNSTPSFEQTSHLLFGKLNSSICTPTLEFITEAEIEYAVLLILGHAALFE